MKSKIVMILILLVAGFFFVTGFLRYQGNLRETLAKEITEGPGSGIKLPNESPSEEPSETPGEMGPVENPQMVELPDFYEKSLEESKEILAEMKLQVKVVEETNSSFAEGIVFLQEPVLGKKILQGKSVTLFVSGTGVSQEEQKTTVPLLIGMEEEEAVELLQSLGFQVKFEYNPSSNYEKGLVYSQNYLVDSKVSRGTKVTIRVSTGS